MSSIKRDAIDAEQALANLDSVIAEWALTNATKIRRSCASCIYAAKSGPFYCALYNTVPPLDVIMDGCNKYEDEDPMPF